MKSKRYYLLLALLTVIAAVVSLFLPAPKHTLIGTALYVAAVTAVAHILVTMSVNKDARSFIRNFFAITVGTLMLHLVVIVLWSFTHRDNAKYFLLSFLAAYFAYTTFETISLVVMMKKAQRERADIDADNSK